MNTTYATHTPRTEKFINLVGDLQNDIKTLVKKEIELAKTEMGEKFSALGRNAGYAAAGGVLALMAAFMLLLGLGAIVARLLVAAGLSPAASYFIAYMGLALVLGAVGYALIQKALHAFKKISLSPEKALASAQAAEPVPIEIKRKQHKQEDSKPKPSSDDLQTQVIAARSRMDNEISELRARLTPGYIGRSFVAGLKHHPLRAVLLSAASTGLGGYLYYRKQQKLAAIRKHTGSLRRWLNVKMHHA
jgi:hypothetical protein